MTENSRSSSRTPRKRRRVLRLAVLFVVLLFGACLLYFEMYYHAGQSALAVLDGESGDGSVSITESSDGWLFDGPGEVTCVILYPGAKVQAAAYAPLMEELAAAGTDGYLLRLPLRFAFFGINKADGPMEEYTYDHWYVAGHSLGGVAASSYGAGHIDAVEGVILLASYPTKDLSALKVLSVYGDRDEVLDPDAYSDSKDLWPKDAGEVVIEGGNHAGIADYGPQKGDGKAGISPEEQRKETVEAIRDFLAGQL